MQPGRAKGTDLAAEGSSSYFCSKSCAPLPAKSASCAHCSEPIPAKGSGILLGWRGLCSLAQLVLPTCGDLLASLVSFRVHSCALTSQDWSSAQSCPCWKWRPDYTPRQLAARSLMWPSQETVLVTFCSGSNLAFVFRVNKHWSSLFMVPGPPVLYTHVASSRY
jgi:hypothetical protein